MQGGTNTSSPYDWGGLRGAGQRKLEARLANRFAILDNAIYTSCVRMKSSQHSKLHTCFLHRVPLLWQFIARLLK